MDPILGLALLSLAINAGSYIFGFNSTQRTNDTNLQISRETNEAQTEIHREDNAFNAAEAEKAREYNSIGSQLERGREAGVSDWFTLGQPSTTASSASASNMPGLHVPQMQNPFAQIGASPLDLASSLKSLADAKKAGAETKEIETLLGLKVDEAQQDIIAKKLQNELTQTFGAGIQQVTLDRMCADIAHLEALAREAHTNADFNLEKKALAQLEQVTERYKGKLTRQQYKLAKKDVASYADRLNAELKVKESEAGRNKAQTNEANAAAQLSRETANRIHELLPSEKELNEKLLQHEGEKIKLTQENKKLVAQQVIDALIGNGKSALEYNEYQSIVEFTEAKIEQEYQRLKDYNSMPQWLRWLGNIFGSASAGVGAAAIKASK